MAVEEGEHKAGHPVKKDGEDSELGMRDDEEVQERQGLEVSRHVNTNQGITKILLRRVVQYNCNHWHAIFMVAYQGSKTVRENIV